MRSWCTVAEGSLLRPSCVSPQIRLVFTLRCVVSFTAIAASTCSDLAPVFWFFLRLTTTVEHYYQCYTLAVRFLFAPVHLSFHRNFANGVATLQSGLKSNLHSLLSVKLDNYVGKLWTSCFVS